MSHKPKNKTVTSALGNPWATASRPAYSGYFNALVAPAALLPLAGAVIIEVSSISGVFLVSLAAAILQYITVRHLRALSAGNTERC